MPDPLDRPELPKPRSPSRGSRRRQRFVLPPDHHDERAAERIEAFLEGPSKEPTVRPAPAPAVVPSRSRRRIPLATRADWERALQREDQRFARYGRPVAVLVVAVRPDAAGRDDDVAGEVGAVIREHARSTDRAARVGPTRFHVLLPETSEADAIALAERVRSACTARAAGGEGQQGCWAVDAAVASPAPGATLLDALRVAVGRLGD